MIVNKELKYFRDTFLGKRVKFDNGERPIGFFVVESITLCGDGIIRLKSMMGNTFDCENCKEIKIVK